MSHLQSTQRNIYPKCVPSGVPRGARHTASPLGSSLVTFCLDRKLPLGERPQGGLPFGGGAQWYTGRRGKYAEASKIYILLSLSTIPSGTQWCVHYRPADKRKGRGHCPPLWARTWVALYILSAVNGCPGYSVTWFIIGPAFSTLRYSFVVPLKFASLLPKGEPFRSHGHPGIQCAGAAAPSGFP